MCNSSWIVYALRFAEGEKKLKEIVEAILTVILFYVFAYVWTEIVSKGRVILGAILLGAFIMASANYVAKKIVNIF